MLFGDIVTGMNRAEDRRYSKRAQNMQLYREYMELFPDAPPEALSQLAEQLSGGSNWLRRQLPTNEMIQTFTTERAKRRRRAEEIERREDVNWGVQKQQHLSYYFNEAIKYSNSPEEYVQNLTKMVPAELQPDLQTQLSTMNTGLTFSVKRNEFVAPIVQQAIAEQWTQETIKALFPGNPGLADEVWRRAQQGIRDAALQRQKTQADINYTYAQTGLTGAQTELVGAQTDRARIEADVAERTADAAVQQANAEADAAEATATIQGSNATVAKATEQERIDAAGIANQRGAAEAKQAEADAAVAAATVGSRTDKAQAEADILGTQRDVLGETAPIEVKMADLNYRTSKLAYETAVQKNAQDVEDRKRQLIDSAETRIQAILESAITTNKQGGPYSYIWSAIVSGNEEQIRNLLAPFVDPSIPDFEGVMDRMVQRAMDMRVSAAITEKNDRVKVAQQTAATAYDAAKATAKAQLEEMGKTASKEMWKETFDLDDSEIAIAMLTASVAATGDYYIPSPSDFIRHVAEQVDADVTDPVSIIRSYDVQGTWEGNRTAFIGQQSAGVVGETIREMRLEASQYMLASEESYEEVTVRVADWDKNGYPTTWEEAAPFFDTVSQNLIASAKFLENMGNQLESPEYLAMVSLNEIQHEADAARIAVEEAKASIDARLQQLEKMKAHVSARINEAERANLAPPSTSTGSAGGTLGTAAPAAIPPVEAATPEESGTVIDSLLKKVPKSGVVTRGTMTRGTMTKTMDGDNYKYGAEFAEIVQTNPAVIGPLAVTAKKKAEALLKIRREEEARAARENYLNPSIETYEAYSRAIQASSIDIVIDVVLKDEMTSGFGSGLSSAEAAVVSNGIRNYLLDELD